MLMFKIFMFININIQFKHVNIEKKGQKKESE